MTTEQPLEIPLSKSKLVLMLIGALAFVAIGFWFVIAPPKIDNSYWGHPIKLAIIGYGSILFFGLCAILFMRKLPDTKPGLIIDSEGLMDNSGGTAAGRILWADIENISVLEIQKQKLIMIEVTNPEDYIGRQRSLWKRKVMQMNYKMYGTPISISANGLKMKFDDLLSALLQRLHQAKTNVAPHYASVQAEK